SHLSPLECLQKLEGRIVTFHFKDLNDFGPSAHDVPWGTGKANVPELLAEIRRQNIKAVFSIEYEHNWDNSMPEIAQCVEFFEKVAKNIGTVKKTEALLGKIAVQSGKFDRQDTPVSLDLSQLPDPWRPLRLTEVKGDTRIPIPSQMDPSGQPVLWWILNGKTAADSVRTFELYEGDPVASMPVIVRQDEGWLEIVARGARVLRYNNGYVVPPVGTDPRYIRSGYIHPAWSPTGLMVTEDFPADHLHHKGIWSAWTKTEFEGRHPDLWNLKGGTGTVRFAGFDWSASGAIFGGFAADMVHTDLSASPAKEALNERWEVRVWNLGGPDDTFWLWDLTSVQKTAGDSPLLLPDYRYGGFGFRGSVEWVDEKLNLQTSEGKTRVDGHGTKSRWCDMSGPVGQGYAGVTILTHPSNFRFPQPMRIWDKGGTFFCYAPPLDGDFAIEPGKDFVSRYRYLIHDGEADRNTIERFWNDFAEPPVVEASFQ
ncbi:MAG TPA: PmoA family protein, partial [bacterium]|nr:PmoA family protein [bacterium]